MIGRDVTSIVNWQYEWPKIVQRWRYVTTWPNIDLNVNICHDSELSKNFFVIKDRSYIKEVKKKCASKQI